MYVNNISTDRPKSQKAGNSYINDAIMQRK